MKKLVKITGGVVLIGVAVALVATAYTTPEVISPGRLFMGIPMPALTLRSSSIIIALALVGLGLYPLLSVVGWFTD
jgi:hypothetical protein